jgi:uncharacterized protein
MTLRVVVDTNILVSGVIKPQGTIGAVIQRLRRRAYTLLLSRATLDEVVAVLHRPKLRIKYQLSDRILRATLRMIVLRSELVEPDVEITACRDPKDNQFLEVAVSGKADVIVSGDGDLRILTPYEGIPIIAPNQFLAMLDHPG